MQNREEKTSSSASRLTQKPCGYVPNICLFQGIIFSIVGINADKVKGGNYTVEIKSHQYKAIDHLLVIASISTNTRQQGGKFTRSKGTLTAQLALHLALPWTFVVSASRSPIWSHRCLRPVPVSALRHASQPTPGQRVQTLWDFALTCPQPPHLGDPWVLVC